MKKWEIKNKKKVFDGKVFTIIELDCFHPVKRINHDFYMVSAPDWINVVVLDKEKQFIMVRQHWLGSNSITIETPAGMIENGELGDESLPSHKTNP